MNPSQNLALNLAPSPATRDLTPDQDLILNQLYEAQFLDLKLQNVADKIKFYKNIRRMQFISSFDSYLHVKFNLSIHWFITWSVISNMPRILISKLQVSADSLNGGSRMSCIELRQNLWLLYAWQHSKSRKLFADLESIRQQFESMKLREEILWTLMKQNFE